MTLPGTRRRPLKPWFRCSEEEKLAEAQLACMLDRVIALAVEDGVPLPDVEDSTIDGRLVPFRSARFQKFRQVIMAWHDSTR
jgi:hypothetical protein